MAREVFRGIYRELRDRIEQGTYGFQELLPSESEFVREFGCSHNTIRKALAMLTREGYVQPIQGKGVRCIFQRGDRARFAIGGIETFKETARRNALSVRTRVISFEHVVTDEEISRSTGFPVGTELIYMIRVRLLDGEALILDRNYLLASAFAGLTISIAEDSIYEYVEQVLGMRMATSRRVITAERATDEDRRLLDMGDYDFVAVVTGQTYNSEGVFVEHTESRHRPDHFTFYSTATRE